ncbi:MAG: hypothetical protein EHM56_10610, partial [Chloroflexi bacterium]
MVRLTFLLLMATMAMVLAACSGDVNGTQEPATSAAAVGADAEPEATASPGLATTATASPGATTTAAASPSPSPSAEATETSPPATATRQASTPSPAPTPTSSPAPSATPAPTATAAPTAPAPDPAAVALELQAVVEGLASPSGIVSAGDGSGRLFIREQTGRIRIVEDGTLIEAPFLDVVDRVTS